MSGKKRFDSNMKDGRGGARPNSGPKRIIKTHSEAVKNNYIKAAKRLEKEFGMPIEEAVLRLAYDEKTQDSVKLGVLKAYAEALIVKEVEQKVEVNKPVIGPAICLPPMNEDPALKIINGRKDG